MKISNIILKILMPLALGGAILYWMYRGEDWQTIVHVATDEMNWTWMLLSFPFGILAQAFRGWRWRQTLEPVGEKPRTSVSVHSIFLSYAVSLLIPRVGEFTRCGVLKRYDNISFPKALGTVVTERAIDSLLVMGITMMVLLLEMSTFGTFFQKTGTSIQGILQKFSLTGYLVVAVCLAAILILLHFLLRKLSIYNKVRATLRLVTFIVGSIAVIVPTPNGAGPWHFAVKTMLILYGVADEQALYFVLIVHTIQTMLVVLLGVYAWLALNFTKIK